MKMLLRKTSEGSAALARRGAVLDRLERQILILANGQRSTEELGEMMGPAASTVIERLLQRELLTVEVPSAPAGVIREGAGTSRAPVTAAPTSVTPATSAPPAAPVTSAAPATSVGSQFADTAVALRTSTDSASAEPTYHPSPTVLRLYAAGLTSTEIQLLRAAATLSQRQQITLTLLDEPDAMRAEAVVLAGDTEALREHLQLPWMEELPIVWLGGGPAPEGQYVIPRPVPWVRLPTLLSEMLALNAPSEQPKADPNQRAPRVLVVDDSLAVRRYLTSVLASTGVEITEADSGEAALVAFKEDKRGFDCVLLDVIMPGIDGYDTCRALKHTYVREREPSIIMLTSRTSPFDRIRGKFAGCDAYLAKPVDVPKLKATLSRFVAITNTDTRAGGVMLPPVLKTS